MATPMVLSGRTIRIHAQTVMCLLSRHGSTGGNHEKFNDIKKKNNNNDLIRPVFMNRNPRNLELLTIASKPEGYHLDNFEVTFWHKLVVKRSQHTVSAEVVHNNGLTVVSASATEFGIKRFLYKASDVSAFKAIGKVLARRCLESGINSVYFDIEVQEGTKLAGLVEELKKGGLSLSEPESYTLPHKFTRKKPSKPWDIVP